MKKIALVVVCLGCKDAGGSPPVPANGATPASLTVSSGAFSADSPIPTDNTCDGVNQSPQLSWTAVPTTVKSIAVVVDDPDAPSGTFTHWIVWNIKPEMRLLGPGGGGGLGGGQQGTNDMDKVGYSGPCPPKGKVHHYRFTVYGLDTTTLNLRASDRRPDLNRAINNHILAQGTLVGTYQH
jgi:Raf kinase inhibitor-like YbhB/YbcL family protein